MPLVTTVELLVATSEGTTASDVDSSRSAARNYDIILQRSNIRFENYQRVGNGFYFFLQLKIILLYKNCSIILYSVKYSKIRLKLYKYTFLKYNTLLEKYTAKKRKDMCLKSLNYTQSLYLNN